MPDSILKSNALKYASGQEIEIADYLGGGSDGTVWLTNRNTALKALQYQKNYYMELGCYQRLSQHGITKIRQLSVPRLVGFDDSLQVIEMSTVSAPYLIDFGKAYLDRQPEHTQEVWQHYYDQQRERFGDNFGEVQAVLWQLRQLGIYYQDPTPGNIKFIEE